MFAHQGSANKGVARIALDTLLQLSFTLARGLRGVGCGLFNFVLCSDHSFWPQSPAWVAAFCEATVMWLFSVICILGIVAFAVDVPVEIVGMIGPF
jgi:hypothetical protein